MAKKMTAPPNWSKRPNRDGGINDFSPYVDGDPWELVQGEDFTVQLTTVYQAAQKYAKDNGYDLDYKITKAADDEPGRIAVRFRKQPTQF